MKINKIVETALYCDSVPEMVDFYQRVFDFKHVYGYSERNAFLQCGESVLIIFDRALTQVKKEGQVVPSHGTTGPGHIAIEVEDGSIDFWKNHLAEKQVTLEAEITWENSRGSSLYFRDPANNSIELVEAKHWNFFKQI